MREEAHLLDDVANLAAQDNRIDLADVFAIDEDRPAGRLDQAIDHLERGRLATAARPHQHADLSRLNGEGRGSFTAATVAPLRWLSNCFET
ncbi:MAG: hypothetical protein KatS3mg061_2593 [Dehalococcoidia bacterium]|nr:MAG: hypothetical protein KatS3mg061_2593 [Dehalococcoidia bacterium]